MNKLHTLSSGSAAICVAVALVVFSPLHLLGAITLTNSSNGAFDDVALDPFSYTVQNTNSTLVVGFYVDSDNAVTVNFAGEAADGLFQNGRTWIAYWLNPATGSGTLDINGISAGSGGQGADLLVGAYELAGVNLAASVTNSTGGSITTLTDNEYAISFSGRNTNTEQTPTGSTIIDADVFALNSTDIVIIPGGGAGGGSVGGGGGLSGSAGLQDVSWTAGDVVSLSFQAVPEPSSLNLFCLAGLLCLRRRRC